MKIPNRHYTTEQVLITLSQFEPLNYREYSELVGIEPKAGYERLRRLWDIGILHIARWERSRTGQHQPCYAIGRILDAPKLAKLTASEKSQKYRKRITAEKGAAWKAQKKKKAARHKKRMKTDPAYAAKTRAIGAASQRKRDGSKPRLPNVSKLDPVMAAMMGRKSA